MTPEEKAEFDEWKKSGGSIKSLKEEEERIRQDVIESRKFRRGEKSKDEEGEDDKDKDKKSDKDFKPDPLETRTKASNKKHALNRFITAHPEYAPENDSGNVRYNKLKSEFDGLRDDSAITVDDYLELVEKAHKLIAPLKKPEGDDKKFDEEDNEDDGSMGKTFGNKKEKSGPRLTAEEKEIAKSVGLSEEAYARQKNRFG